MRQEREPSSIEEKDTHDCTKLVIPTEGGELAKKLHRVGDPSFRGSQFFVVVVPEDVDSADHTSVGAKWKFSDVGKAKSRGEYLNARFYLTVIGISGVSKKGKKRKR